jgi:hypothetical protein
MYIGTEFRQTTHVRTGRYGRVHNYFRKKTVVILQCDCCKEVFTRDKGDMDPKRLSNAVYHVCSNCDAKKFAQEKGVEARRIWDIPASSLKTIDQF